MIRSLVFYINICHVLWKVQRSVLSKVTVGAGEGMVCYSEESIMNLMFYSDSSTGRDGERIYNLSDFKNIIE